MTTNTLRRCPSCQQPTLPSDTAEFCPACLLLIYQQAQDFGGGEPPLPVEVSPFVQIAKSEPQNIVSEFIDAFIEWQERQPDYKPPTPEEIALFNQLTGFASAAPFDTDGGDDEQT